MARGVHHTNFLTYLGILLGAAELSRTQCLETLIEQDCNESRQDPDPEREEPAIPLPAETPRASRECVVRVSNHR